MSCVCVMRISCGADAAGTEWEQFAFMRDALNKTGRPVYLSICEIENHTSDGSICDQQAGIAYSPNSWFAEGLPVAELGNGILVEYSNNGNTWQSLDCMIQAQQKLTRANLSAPGIWNDNDMLTVGCSDHHVNEPWTPCISHSGGLSPVEDRTQFTFWTISASPLLLGNDLRYMSAATLATVSNPEVIAVNQDPLGHRGVLSHTYTPAGHGAPVLVYSKHQQPNGSMQRRGVAVINLGNVSAVRHSLSLCLSLSLSPSALCS